MPFSNALRNAFAQDPQTFLRNYHVRVMGSLADRDTGRVNRLMNSMPGGVGGPWDIPHAGIHTDLRAPQLFAYFNDAEPSPDHTMIPFAHDQVVINFDAANAVHGVPGLLVSLIPYHLSLWAVVRCQASG